MKEFLELIKSFPWIQVKDYSLDQSKMTISVEFWAKPGSKLNQVKFKDGVLSVFVKERPIDGEANLGFIQFFSEIFETPKNQIEIMTGLKGKSKRIQITMTGKDPSWSLRTEKIKRLLLIESKE